MKKIIVFICLMNIGSLWSQFSPAENEMMEIVKKNGATVPPSVFLDSSTVKNMQLANVTSWRHIWSDDADDSLKQIMQFYDIRLKFETNKEALKFHKKYLGLNSEFGPRIRKHGVNHEGADAFYIYSGSKVYSEMMKPYGFKIICYLFVVDNYFVKLYVTCLTEYQPINFQDFVNESIKRIKNS